MIRKTYNRKFNLRKPIVLRKSYASQKAKRSHNSLNNYLVNVNDITGIRRHFKDFEDLIHRDDNYNVNNGNVNGGNASLSESPFKTPGHFLVSKSFERQHCLYFF